MRGGQRRQLHQNVQLHRRRIHLADGRPGTLIVGQRSCRLAQVAAQPTRQAEQIHELGAAILRNGDLGSQLDLAQGRGPVPLRQRQLRAGLEQRQVHVSVRQRLGQLLPRGERLGRGSQVALRQAGRGGRKALERLQPGLNGRIGQHGGLRLAASRPLTQRQGAAAAHMSEPPAGRL